MTNISSFLQTYLGKKEVDEIDTKRSEYTLDYIVIFYCSSYQIDGKRVLGLLRILAKIENRELLSRTSQNIINFFWKKYKRLFWIKCAFYGTALGLFVSFAVTRSLADSDVASKLLIALDVCVGVIAAFESLQIMSNLSDYFTDFWNYVDMLLLSVTIVISALFWTEANADALSFFVSTGVILFFSKTLISFRVIDQLRNFIRMIIEVLKGMRAFLIIIVSYLIAFAIIFYQSRRAISDDSPEDSVDEGNFANDLMEMFYLIFTGGNSTNYSGVMIPFYLLVVVFQCLVLLNLIISIIGETYGQVKEDFDIIDLKERINMLLEIAEEAAVIKTVTKKIWCQKRRGRWFKQNVVANEEAAHKNSQSNLNDKFVLVVEKFERKSGSDVSIKED